MKWLSAFLTIAAVWAAIVLVGSFPMEASYASRAQLVQRMEVDPAAAELFGDAGTPVGSPQMMIIEDSKAFMEGQGPEGARLVNDAYLKEHQIYPLQLQTVRNVLGLVRVGASVGLVVSLLGLALFKRRARLRSEVVTA